MYPQLCENQCFFTAVPTPPQKVDKSEDESESSGDSDDDDEGGSENPATAEYQVPTKVCVQNALILMYHIFSINPVFVFEITVFWGQFVTKGVFT